MECDNGRAKPLDCVLITCPVNGLNAVVIGFESSIKYLNSTKEIDGILSSSNMGISHDFYVSSLLIYSSTHNSLISVKTIYNLHVGSWLKIYLFQYGGGVGCVETNPEALKKADSTELAKDLSNFLEKVDLSAPKAKADTKNVVNAIMSNAPSGTMG